MLGPNGALELPGLRPERIGSLALHLPEFQQLRDQKPGGLQNFVFDFVVYRLAASTAAPAPAAVAVDDFSAQVRGFYHPEQIDGQALAWTNGTALLRLPCPLTAAHADSQPGAWCDAPGRPRAGASLHNRPPRMKLRAGGSAVHRRAVYDPERHDNDRLSAS